MKFEYEELRKQIFGDERNTFLKRLFYRNLERRDLYGIKDPLDRQTGRSTRRALEGIIAFKKNPDIKNIRFVGYHHRQAEELRRKFKMHAKTLGIDISDVKLTTDYEGNDKRPPHEEILDIYDHAMP